MLILILYTTYSSGTQTVSTVIEEILARKNHHVTRKLVKNALPSELTAYDFVILASPSWWNEEKDGMPHHDFISFLKKCEDVSLMGKQYAIVGLGDTSYARFCGAVDHLAEFVSQHGGTIVGEPLRIDGYYFNEEKNNGEIAKWVDMIVQTYS